MPSKSADLLMQIEEGALGARVPLADTLRKCVALGGRAGSVQLRDWARLELDGYASEQELPNYRVVPAMIAIDGATMTAQITQQPISATQLPEGIGEHVKEEVHLRSGAAELQQLVSDPNAPIRLLLPGAAEVARLMNHELQESGTHGQHVTTVYWVLSHSSVVGVLDRIRTTLVALVAELRAVGVGEGQAPSAEAADAAVSIVLHGGKRNNVTVVTATSTGDGPATATGAGKTASNVTRAPSESRLSWLKGPWGLVVGAAGLVGAYAAVAAPLNFWPF